LLEIETHTPVLLYSIMCFLILWQDCWCVKTDDDDIDQQGEKDLDDFEPR